MLLLSLEKAKYIKGQRSVFIDGEAICRARPGDVSCDLRQLKKKIQCSDLL